MKFQKVKNKALPIIEIYCVSQLEKEVFLLELFQGLVSNRCYSRTVGASYQCGRPTMSSQGRRVRHRDCPTHVCRNRHSSTSTDHLINRRFRWERE
jgi:hypothetical protein